MTALRNGFNFFQNNFSLTLQNNGQNKGCLIAYIFARNLSVQKITKNISLVSNDKKKIDKEKFIISNGSDAPLVILHTWLLAKPKHINKFNKLYLDQGFDVLNISITPWQLLWPKNGTQLIANDLVKILDVNRSCSPLLLHGFSVGGYVWAESLVTLTEEQTRYQHIIDRICGQIWDSAADITEIPVGFPKAVFPNNTTLENAFRQYIIYHMKTFHKVATCHYIRASQIFHTTVVRAPALFLLSKSDPVGAYSSNWRVKESWESMGMDVQWKCWDKSPHVSHLYYHPKEYMTEFYKFLGKLELINNPEKMQLRI